ncbi:MAG: hypothetical protein AAF713_08620 [Pseudomonadota bacterium]
MNMIAKKVTGVDASDALDIHLAADAVLRTAQTSVEARLTTMAWLDALIDALPLRTLMAMAVAYAQRPPGAPIDAVVYTALTLSYCRRFRCDWTHAGAAILQAATVPGIMPEDDLIGASA